MQNVALIGCGFMGRMHANVYRLLDNAQLVAAIDHMPEKARRFGEEFGVSAYATLAEAGADRAIDVVDICLPTYLHKEATLEAAASGRHIFCEKPMALSVDDADAMIAAAGSARVRLMIGHCIRFWPEYAWLKEMVDSGSMGRLLSLNLTRYGEFPSWASDNWQADESKAGGGAMDMHIHDTDFALYLLGEPKEIRSAGSVDERGVSQIFTTMAYPGCVVQLEGGWNLPPGTPFKMAFRAIFERGAAIMDGPPLTVYEVGKEPFIPEFPKMAAAGGGNISDLGGYHVELKYFFDALESNSDLPQCTPESSRLSLATAIEEIRQVKALA